MLTRQDKWKKQLHVGFLYISIYLIQANDRERMQFLYLDCYEVKGLDFIQVPVELTNFIIYKCQVNMV